MKQITQEELELLQKTHSDFNNTKLSLADIEIAIKQLELKKIVVFSELEKISLDYKDIETNLLEKYGDVSINLNTGKIND
jgi:hypothetical protein